MNLNELRKLAGITLNEGDNWHTGKGGPTVSATVPKYIFVLEDDSAEEDRVHSEILTDTFGYKHLGEIEPPDSDEDDEDEDDEVHPISVYGKGGTLKEAKELYKKVGKKIISDIR